MKRNLLFAVVLSAIAVATFVIAKDSKSIRLIETTPCENIRGVKADVTCEGNSVLVMPYAGVHESEVRMEGEWNFADYKAVSFTLENLDSKPLRVTLHIANTDKYMVRSMSRRSVPETVGDMYYLDPYEKREVVLNFPEPLQYPDVEATLRKSPMRYTPYSSEFGIASYSADLTAVRHIVFQACYLALFETNHENGWRVSDLKVLHGKRKENPAEVKMSHEEFFPFIDQYGQYKYNEWENKIHSDEELQKAREAEEADLAKYTGPTDRNKYGGWANGPRHEATGRFYFKKVDGQWWFIDPEGCLWWSHGAVRVTPSSGLTPLDDRREFFENLPSEGSEFEQFYYTHDALLKPYYTVRNIKETYDFSSSNCYRKYGKDYKNVYAELAHRRLQSWGLNTIANSSDKDICLMSKTPYIERLEVRGQIIEGSGGTWWRFVDPWDPSFKQSVINQLKAREKELKDPYLVGLFVDNELKWGDEWFLAATIAKNPSTLKAKHELIKHYKAKYNGCIKALNTAWGTSFASWDALLKNEQDLPEQSHADLVEFNDQIIHKYFRNCREVFNEYAPGVLYLGCRFSNSNKKAIVIGAQYCDAISHNFYRFTLDDYTQPEGIDKPLIIGEFHFGTRDRGPFHHSLIEVDSQEERGKAYEAYVRSALEHPNIVGTHWHQFADQATTGRFDGENFNVGFTDICDTPYKEMVEALRNVGYEMYNIRANAK